MKICKKCNQEKSLEEFCHYKNSIDGYQSHCKTCRKEVNRIYRNLNKDKTRQRNKIYRTNNKEKVLEWERKSAKGRRQKARLSVLEHYSNGTLKCAKCDWNDIRALSIDHINGGGKKHLREIGGHLEEWLVKNNFPEGFQVLCMNHQFVKRHENNEMIPKKRTYP